MILTGNLVLRDRCAYGKLTIQNGLIDAVSPAGPPRPDEDWILPGFIDVHLHGIYHGSAAPELVHKMVEEAPQSGLTSFCPAMASDTPDNMLDFVVRVRELMQAPLPGGAKLAGSHLEGPYLAADHCGGMNPAMLRLPDPAEIGKILVQAPGALKIMTIAPELPGALEAVRILTAGGVLVSAGHTGMRPEAVDDFVRAGGKAVCHLFDTFDGRTVENGVSQVSLADAVLVDDRLMIEVIGDGIHVPPALVRLAVRAAGVGRILGITDSLSGTGLPDGSFPMTDAGRSFTLKNGDVCRLTDDPSVIVGSCLTQNRAFYNYVRKFGFSPAEAAQILSGNAARYLGIAHRTGELQVGLAADIAVLAPDQLTVQRTLIDGETVYERL